MGEALFEVFQEHIVESLPLFCLITGELSGIAKNLFQNRGEEVEVLLLTRLRPDGGSRGLQLRESTVLIGGNQFQVVDILLDLLRNGALRIGERLVLQQLTDDGLCLRLQSLFAQAVAQHAEYERGALPGSLRSQSLHIPSEELERRLKCPPSSPGRALTAQISDSCDFFLSELL